MGYLFDDEEHFAYHNYSNAEYDGKANASFLGGIIFIQMITSKLYYSAGIQLKTRKMRMLYSLSDYSGSYGNYKDPVAEETQYYRDLEYPVMIGLNFNKFSLQGGINVLVFRYFFREVKSQSGNIYSNSGYPDYKLHLYPGITASYLLSNKQNIFIFAGVEKQLLYSWYLGNVGLSMTFGLLPKKGNIYRYCKPPG